MKPRARPSSLRRLLLAGVATALLTSCGNSPPVRLYHLSSQPPVPPTTPAAAGEAWQLLLPVRIPEYLDREAILLPQGQTGLLALSGHRWAESLRDAVPRVLRQDLAALRGESRIWTAPLPAGVTVARQVRVEVSALQAEASGAGVLLQARWTRIDPAGRVDPRSQGVTLQVAVQGASIDDLVTAHRLVLWRLAERIAADP